MPGSSPLTERSSNTANMKKRRRDAADEVSEGAALEWLAAAFQKRHKSEPVGLDMQSIVDVEEDSTSKNRANGAVREQSIPKEPTHSHVGVFTSGPFKPEASVTWSRWVADPMKLPPGKKRKYYGVRKGRQPGIYYSWKDAEAQVNGFPGSIHTSAKDARAIEHFMNHLPEDCIYPTCGSLCTSAAARARAAAALAVKDAASPNVLPWQTEERQPTSKRPVCECNNPKNASAGTVDCASATTCTVGTYHKLCVGLASRTSAPGWRCAACRRQASTTPGSSIPASSSSQAPHRDQIMSGSAQMFPLTDVTPLATSSNTEPPLHPEQEAVVRCIEQGHNVFYTGSAGTGKSTVLKAFVKRLKKLGKKVDIVAPSGIAALNVGGRTVFNYASWRPDSFKEPLRTLLGDAHGNKVSKKLCKTDVLVIDEISMIERDLFLRLSAVMQAARGGCKDEKTLRDTLSSSQNRQPPFGGCQIVVTGDFCQLPPVRPFRFCVQCGGDELQHHDKQDGRDLECRKCPRKYADADKWAFRSPQWEDCQFTCFELKHVHRQSDAYFISILQKCRLGIELEPSEKSALTKPKPDPAGAVKLLPRRAEVDAENAKNFRDLTSSPRTYECLDVFSWRNKDEPELKKNDRPKYADKPEGTLVALKDHRFEEKVQLKEGMLVILLNNLSWEDGLCNGSQGRIVGFEKYDANIPVLPRPVDASPSKSGKRGGRDPEVHELMEYKERQIRKFIERAEIAEWPIIQFYNGIKRAIYADCQLSELGTEKPYSLLGRTQIPLLAAWAITVHKSQGMTLERVIVDLYNSFEREMVYVALSRAKNMDGLKVVRLARDLDMGSNKEVEEFLRLNFKQSATSVVEELKHP